MGAAIEAEQAAAKFGVTNHLNDLGKLRKILTSRFHLREGRGKLALVHYKAVTHDHVKVITSNSVSHDSADPQQPTQRSPT